MDQQQTTRRRILGTVGIALLGGCSGAAQDDQRPEAEVSPTATQTRVQTQTEARTDAAEENDTNVEIQTAEQQTTVRQTETGVERYADVPPKLLSYSFNENDGEVVGKTKNTSNLKALYSVVAFLEDEGGNDIYAENGDLYWIADLSVDLSTDDIDPGEVVGFTFSIAPELMQEAVRYSLRSTTDLSTFDEMVGDPGWIPVGEDRTTPAESRENYAETSTEAAEKYGGVDGCGLSLDGVSVTRLNTDRYKVEVAVTNVSDLSLKQAYVGIMPYDPEGHLIEEYSLGVTDANPGDGRTVNVALNGLARFDVLLATEVHQEWAEAGSYSI